ncbi:YoaK family protein [Sphingomonas donggukensis]|uniref:YoaK family protein n=1 Tax=Sphingomonas donggukensis TaxID=2949093 RepID=A0ABY4TTN2_9SPHN|nr:YoaK family protein [Sphingomonas donggukensis]URW75764.1 YoaK family protein [Sphingomonas donggukensis]
MTRYPPAMIGIATALATLAGFVDAIAWIELGGFFASFMSGNSTRMGIGIANGDWGALRIAAALVMMFLSGVIAASVVAARWEPRRKVAVMLVVTLAIAVAAGCAWQGLSMAALLLLAFAMGAENGVFNRDGEVSIGVTYMTGTLVRAAQHFANGLMGSGPRGGWVPYLLLWAGFVCGAVLGTVASRQSLASAVTVAAVAAAALTVAVALATAREGRVRRV